MKTNMGMFLLAMAVMVCAGAAFADGSAEVAAAKCQPDMIRVQAISAHMQSISDRIQMVYQMHAQDRTDTSMMQQQLLNLMNERNLVLTCQ